MHKGYSYVITMFHICMYYTQGPSHSYMCNNRQHQPMHILLRQVSVQTSTLRGLNVQVKRTGSDINWKRPHRKITDSCAAVRQRNSHAHPKGAMSQANRTHTHAGIHTNI